LTGFRLLRQEKIATSPMGAHYFVKYHQNYAKQQVEEFNKEYKEGKIDLSIKFDFDEKLTATGDTASKSTLFPKFFKHFC
jgi:hypothetical protein